MIKKEIFNFTFSKENKPELIVKAGEDVTFETYDCMTGQIKSQEDKVDAIDFDKVNPATGPVFIEDAKCGDILKVTIKSINLVGNAVALAGSGVGVLEDVLDELSLNIIEINDKNAIFKGIELPLNKMIGVIGVAPKSGEVNCGTPGSHGGNMDCKVIREGASIYFPIFNDGALLSLGDVHALMGDGEIGVSGAEIAAEVTVTVDIIKNTNLQNPIVEDEEAYYTIASADTLDEAQRIAVNNMFDLIRDKSKMSKNDLAMLLSLTADLQICQVVDPLKTIRFKVKKCVLQKLGIENLI